MIQWSSVILITHLSEKKWNRTLIFLPFFQDPLSNRVNKVTVVVTGIKFHLIYCHNKLFWILVFCVLIYHIFETYLFFFINSTRKKTFSFMLSCLSSVLPGFTNRRLGMVRKPNNGIIRCNCFKNYPYYQLTKLHSSTKSSTP